MTTNPAVEYPSQGWQHVLAARKEILDGFGTLEAGAIRKWLEGFLPRRFAVTAGFIVSSGRDSRAKAPRFEVIIYDQLESPVLWIEEGADVSGPWKTRAIPVEHVLCVLEVKSHFSAETAKEAIVHLAEMLPLMSGFDDPAAPYKLYLPATFSCGIVFAELAKAEQRSDAAMNQLTAGIRLRGYFGGTILRGEGHASPATGLIALGLSPGAVQGTLRNEETSILEFAYSDSLAVAEDDHVVAVVSWAEAQFARFAFDLVARLRGIYDPGTVSSFYGMGQSFKALVRQSREKPG